jgi:predicted ABC-type ATPase
MKVAEIRITEAILSKLGLLSLVNFNAREYNRVSFAFETVFSHPSKLKLMQRAKESGYWV